MRIMIYITSESGYTGWWATVCDDESSDWIDVWFEHHDQMVVWLKMARASLSVKAAEWCVLDGDERMRKAEQHLFYWDLHTPDCGEALSIPREAQVWLRWVCRYAQDAQDVLDDREADAWVAEVAL